MLAGVLVFGLRDQEPLELAVTAQSESTPADVALQPPATMVPATEPAETIAMTEYLELARFSVMLTARCLNEAGFVTSGPWPTPDTLDYQLFSEPGESEMTRNEAVERCARRFAVDAPQDAATIDIVRRELLAEQRFFVDCFDRIASTENEIGSPGVDSSQVVSSELIEASVRVEQGVIRECAARSSDGVSWALQQDSGLDQVMARLVIPAIAVDLLVHEGIDADTLRGPVAGHYLSTELPGQAGNAALAAHRTTHGAPFFRLDELSPGDSVFVTTFQGAFEYQVIGQSIHEPDDVEILDDFGDNRLTLTTGHPEYSNRQRLVVVGELVGQPAHAFPYVEFRSTIENTDTPMLRFEADPMEPGQSMTRAMLIDRLHLEASDVYAGFSAESGIEVFLVGEGSLAAAAAIADAQRAGLEVSVTYGMGHSLEQLLTQQHELGEALASAGFTDFTIALELSTGQLLATLGSTPDEVEQALPTVADASNVVIDFRPDSAGGPDS